MKIIAWAGETSADLRFFFHIAATCSVQELKGLFQGKRSKPVSIEEMNAAIAKRASSSQ